MTDDEVKDAAKDGAGLLLSTGLLGAALARASQGIDKCVVCEDCSVHTPAFTMKIDGWRNCGFAGIVFHADLAPDRPAWPGCRGFKLRPGAKGPDKRYAEKVTAETEELHEKMKRVEKP